MIIILCRLLFQESDGERSDENLVVDVGGEVCTSVCLAGQMQAMAAVSCYLTPYLLCSPFPWLAALCHYVFITLVALQKASICVFYLN